ncbi:EAL domain-containing protein [Jatrophihabitans cynanchi]|uniref:EAL domain-containing protein n=1 Tax=Jatrophihabitans cynanchi TaxID=2944128 RepID=A0ABY7K1X7_9ACTN|nr:EAL domain-containing protein [Jatrophihabitans sp. SB3-54]WAX57607.1 EAL domain-containing protein [Jatrophihabitans sp. SB3-54]
MAALGAVLVRNEQHSGTERGLAQGRAQADVITQMAIAPALDRRDLQGPVSASVNQRLHQAIDLALYKGSLTGIRLRTFDGSIAYSDDAAAASVPSSDPAFRTVADHGGTTVAVVASPDGAPGKAIRVLEPVVPNATGQATGVLELYLPYAPIAEVVQAEEHQTYLRLAEGLGALYVVLALISWSTTRRLRHYAANQAHQARHDPLTELPNRSRFREQAAAAVEAAEQGGQGGAIALVDLDRFKEVNDTLGHHAGDELLQCVAQRLSAAVRTDDLVARLGGDEFGLLLPGVASAEVARNLLREVQRQLSEPMEIDGAKLTVEASVGLALYPKHGTDVSLLMRHADAAMYQGKRGSERTVVWQPESATPHTQWHVLLTELQHALSRDELVLNYQPKIDLGTGQVCGVEALVRWDHPERGFLPPSEFIPVAESSTLIHPLTEWVLRRALGHQRAWQRYGLDWPVAVNVSAHNLEAPGFVAQVLGIVGAFGARPQDLLLELTETALAADNATTEASIVALREAGVQVSLDDFGTGTTGLLQLRSMPVQEIKIDAVFVRELGANSGDRTMVQAMLELAHGIGVRVVAEGVEDQSSRDWLIAAGCDAAQGYYFQRPAPWPELAERFAPLPSHRSAVAEPATRQTVEVVRT